MSTIITIKILFYHLGYYLLKMETRFSLILFLQIWKKLISSISFFGKYKLYLLSLFMYEMKYQIYIKCDLYNLRKAVSMKSSNLNFSAERHNFQLS